MPVALHRDRRSASSSRSEIRWRPTPALPGSSRRRRPLTRRPCRRPIWCWRSKHALDLELWNGVCSPLRSTRAGALGRGRVAGAVERGSRRLRGDRRVRAAPAGLSLRDALRTPGLPRRAAPKTASPFDASRLEPALEAAWTRGIAACRGGSGGGAPVPGAASSARLRCGRGATLRAPGRCRGPSPPISSGAAATSHRSSASPRSPPSHLERHADARRRQRRSGRRFANWRASRCRRSISPKRCGSRCGSPAHGSQARGGALWLGSSPTALRLEATHGPPDARAMGRTLEPLGTRHRRPGRPAAFAAGDSALPAGQSGETLESMALEPLNAYGAVRGVIAVYDRAVPHRAGHGGVRRRRSRVPRRTRGPRRRARRPCRTLRPAARRRPPAGRDGDRTAACRTVWPPPACAPPSGPARRVNPLASIAAFARRMHRGLAEDHPHREYLEIVVREAERLERRLAEPAVPPPPPPALRVENVNAAVQEVLQELSERLVRRRVRLLKRLAPDLPALLIHPERTAAHAAQHSRSGARPCGGRRPHPGRVAPRRRARGDGIANDGARTPGEMLEELFAPFTENRNITARAGPRARAAASCASTAVRCGCAAKASGASVVS